MVSAMRRASARAFLAERRRHPRNLQNMVAVLVLGHVETCDGAIVGARGNNRNFALERHEGFENAGLAADLAPGGCGIAAVSDRRLALAVVTEAARLQNGRPADPLDRRGKLGGRSDSGERRGADAERR